LKIGLLGGTFNPVHIGHLRLAIETLEVYSLDRVWLVPAYISPHKKQENILPYPYRLQMLNLALEGLEKIKISTVEEKLGGISYTVKTLDYLNKNYTQDDFYFILGDGDFLSLPTWYKGNTLLDYASLIVIRRNYIDLQELSQFAFSFLQVEKETAWGWKKGKNEVLLLNSLDINISSSSIRKKFLNHKDLSFLLPAKVEFFLEENRNLVEKFWREKEK